MIRNRLAVLTSVLLAACAAQSPADEGKPGEAQAGAAAAGAPKEKEAKAVAEPAKARDESVSTDSYSFSYSYPAAAAAIPGVRALLEKDLAERRAELAQWAAEGRQASKENDFPFSAYDFGKGWEVVTDLPGWLSLSAGYNTYTGGAHPNRGYDALLWDKGAGRRIEPTDLFRSKQAFVDAVRKDFCAALDKERAERRGGETYELFGDCIDPTDTVIILGSSNRKAFNRIGFLIAPYIAGPYAEGDYEVTLPVTPAVLAAVKPQYRDSFGLAK
jgi:hypothetical protein